MKPNFSTFFFDETVVDNPAQLLAKTWYPYLFWVWGNLPLKIEKLAHVTKLAKKTSPYGHLANLEPQKQNSTIWAPRSSPKMTRPGFESPTYWPKLKL